MPERVCRCKNHYILRSNLKLRTNSNCYLITEQWHLRNESYNQGEGLRWNRRLREIFNSSTHILCQFRVLKAVDAFLTKTKNGAGDKEKYHDIWKRFRAAMYTESQDEFDSSKGYLTGKSKQLFHHENLLNLLIIQSFHYSILFRWRFGKHWGIFFCQLV